MKKSSILIIVILLVFQGVAQRNDAAQQINVSTSNYSGSLQNGSWSPDNQFMMCTNWESGYNQYPANILIIDLSDNTFTSLTTDGESNVNMPGLTWSPAINKVIFSSEHSGDGDQAHIMGPDGLPGSAVKITPWTDRMCWEPGFSPDGEWIVYEAHYLDNVDKGVIETYKIDGTQGPFQLTNSSADSRQPSWSPAGDKIVYQVLNGSIWDIWTMDINGSNKQNITGLDSGDKTDASFSPNGDWIVYSTGNGVLNYANIFIKNLTTEQLIQVTDYTGYDGAPSWSSDNRIVFESTSGDPDISSGSTLWIIDALVLGINQITINNKIYTYPNPASDIITLNIDNINNEDIILNIYNVTGTLARSELLRQNQKQINIVDLSNGVYVVEIKTKEWTEKQKLIIQR